MRSVEKGGGGGAGAQWSCSWLGHVGGSMYVVWTSLLEGIGHLMQKHFFGLLSLIMAVKTRSAGKAVPVTSLGGQREALGRQLRYITRSFMLYEAGIPSVAFAVIVEGTDSSWMTLVRVSVCSSAWRSVHGACVPTCVHGRVRQHDCASAWCLSLWSRPPSCK